ncbi:MAG: 50S ribosomal protein L18 [Phycisphaerae bacterium]
MREESVKRVRQARRKRRVRKKVSGTPARPRLAVWRSHRNISAQIIDDLSGRTLCGISTQSKELREACPYGGNIQAAAAAGKAIGEKARTLGIQQVCFDRGGCAYHGRVKALAQAVREAGLKF